MNPLSWANGLEENFTLQDDVYEQKTNLQTTLYSYARSCRYLVTTMLTKFGETLKPISAKARCNS